MTTRKIFKQSAAVLLPAVLMAGATMAQDIPAKLTPPAGVTVLGAYTAKGVQIYNCIAHGSGTEWSFKAPEAQLVDANGAIFAKHYAGPTWEAVDGSRAIGKVMETSPAPAPGAIPWLLLSAESSGPGKLAGTRFIQRIKTVGGVAESGGCSKPGAEQHVPYSAEYVFYK